MTKHATLVCYRGSISTYAWTWGGTSPVNLSSYAVEVFDAHPDLKDLVSVQMIDPAIGRFDVTVNSETMQIGAVGGFVIRLVPLVGNSPPPQSAPLVMVRVE